MAALLNVNVVSAGGLTGSDHGDLAAVIPPAAGHAPADDHCLILLLWLHT